MKKPTTNAKWLVWRALCELLIENKGLSPTNQQIAVRAGMNTTVEATGVTTHLRRLRDMGHVRPEGRVHDRILHVLKWPDGISPVKTIGRVPMKPRKKPKKKGATSDKKPGAEEEVIWIPRVCVRDGCRAEFMADSPYLRLCGPCRADEHRCN